MPAPVNDLVSNATVITSIPFSVTGFDNTDATESIDDPIPVVAGAAVFKTVWYKYTPASDVSVKFIMTDFPDVGFWIGTGTIGSLVEFVSWDDHLPVSLIGGTTYYIMLFSYTNAGFTFDFSFDTTTEPTNQLLPLAQDLGTTLPVNLTPSMTDVDVWVPNRYLWYKYTGQVGDTVIGFFAFGDLIGFDPTTFLYTNTGADWLSPDPWTGVSTQVFGTNVPVQFPVVPGTTYYIRVGKSSAGALTNTITINAQRAPGSTVPAGSIFINDDTPDLPAGLFSASTGAALGFVYPFPSGEGGDTLASGVIAVTDDVNAKIKVYSSNFVLLSTLDWSLVNSSARIRTSFGQNKFYVGVAGSGAVHAQIKTVDAAGAFGPTTWTLPAAGLTAHAVKEDGSVLYYTGNGGSSNSQIARWDLVNDIAMSDLVAALVNYVIYDILVLSDDSLVVLYMHGGTKDIIIKNFSSAGTLLHTYSLGTAWIGTPTPHLTYALDSPNSFWFWGHLTGGSFGMSRFQNIKVSDGSNIVTFDIPEYVQGAYSLAPTATPSARFGPAFSCPLMITRASYSPSAAASLSGIYFINPGKTDDTVYLDASVGTTEVRKIPDPFIKTGALGN